ncbi:hypothetical protein CapIbe_005845 [Capra ibex]
MSAQARGPVDWQAGRRGHLLPGLKLMNPGEVSENTVWEEDGDVLVPQCNMQDVSRLMQTPQISDSV